MDKPMSAEQLALLMGEVFQLRTQAEAMAAVGILATVIWILAGKKPIDISALLVADGFTGGRGSVLWHIKGDAVTLLDPTADFGLDPGKVSVSDFTKAIRQ